MNKRQVTLTYIGGPTLLIELDGLRLLTDPALDPGGTQYSTPVYTLRKTSGPAIPAEALGRVDAVLLSHDQHFDNLDHAGRAFLPNAGKVLTTPAGADRLGDNAVGLAPWQSLDLPTPRGHTLRVTSTPARHGPAGADRGPVSGFVLTLVEAPEHAVYVSGDTVWYEGVEEVSRQFATGMAILFMGAARVKEVGPAHLTFTAEEAVEAARAFPEAVIVPAHFEGWAHFSESRKEIEEAFGKAGMEQRLRWLAPGKATEVNI